MESTGNSESKTVIKGTRGKMRQPPTFQNKAGKLNETPPTPEEPVAVEETPMSANETNQPSEQISDKEESYNAAFADSPQNSTSTDLVIPAEIIFDGLPEQLRQNIKPICDKLVDNFVQVTKHHIQICKLLVELRKEFSACDTQIQQNGTPHLIRECFFMFVKDAFGLKERTAYEYLRVGANEKLMSLNLDFSKLNLLAKLKNDRMEAVVQKHSEQIKKMSYRALKTIVQKEAKSVVAKQAICLPSHRYIPQIVGGGCLSDGISEKELLKLANNFDRAFRKLEVFVPQTDCPDEVLSLVIDVKGWANWVLQDGCFHPAKIQ